MVLAALTVIVYLLAVNYINTLGIKMGQMKYRIQALSDENRDKENLALSLKSMSRIEEISNTQLSMVKADTYSYLDADGKVAVK